MSALGAAASVALILLVLGPDCRDGRQRRDDQRGGHNPGGGAAWEGLRGKVRDEGRFRRDRLAEPGRTRVT